MDDLNHYVSSLKNGQPDSYAALVRDLSESLLRHVAMIMHDVNSAQDVVQDTFVRLYANRAKLHEEGSLRAYCFFLATRLARNELRARRRRENREQRVSTMHNDSAPHSDAKELAEEAWLSAMSLPTEQREVLSLRFAQGLTIREVARVLSIPEGTVRTRQRSAIEDLRNSLKVSSAMAPIGATELSNLLLYSDQTRLPVTIPSEFVKNMEVMIMKTIRGAGVLSAVKLIVLLAVFIGVSGTIAIQALGPSDSSLELDHMISEATSQSHVPDVNQTGSEKRTDDNTASKPETINKASYVEKTPAVEVEDTPDEVLPEKGIIFGKVLDRHGTPLANHELRLAKAAWGERVALPERILTTKNGSYRIEELDPGTYIVKLANKGEDKVHGLDFLATRSVVVRVGEESEKNIDLSKLVQTGKAVRGRVTVNGESLIPFSILASAHDSSYLKVEEGMKDGNFEYSDVKPGEYDLWFAEEHGDYKGLIAHERIVVQDWEHDILFEKDYKTGSLSGKVSLADTYSSFDLSTVSITPVKQVQTESTWAEQLAGAGSELAQKASVQCDANGNFTFRYLLEGQYKLIAKAKGVSPTYVIANTKDAASSNIVLSTKTGELSVSVTDIKGQESAGHLYSGKFLGESGLLWAVKVYDEAGNVQLNKKAAESTSLGDYMRKRTAKAIGSFPVGSYRAEFSGVGIETYSEQVEVKEGETTSLAVKLHRAASIRIQIENENVDPVKVQMASVEVIHSDGKVVAITKPSIRRMFVELTDLATNSIRVTPLVAGTYTVIVRLDGHGSSQVKVDVGQSSVVNVSTTLK